MTLFQAHDKVEELLAAKPAAEKTREELARENAEAMGQLMARLARTQLG